MARISTHCSSLLTRIASFFAPLKQWWHSPSPGKLGLVYLSEEFDVTCLASAYAGYLPSSYNQKSEWPLVVFLHGSDVRAYSTDQLLQVSQILNHPCEKETPAVVLSPQCRNGSYWQAEPLRQFIEFACQQYRIDQSRIYLLGYSMGGYGVWAAAAKHPELYAAVVPIAGGGNASNASALAKVPIWAFHGNQDEIVSAEESIKLIDAIRAVGGSPKFTLYPELGHGIRSLTCRKPELWDWLFEQNLKHRIQPAPAEEAK